MQYFVPFLKEHLLYLFKWYCLQSHPLQYLNGVETMKKICAGKQQRRKLKTFSGSNTHAEEEALGEGTTGMTPAKLLG